MTETEERPTEIVKIVRKRTARDGPRWGDGPYKGIKVYNHHIRRAMFALPKPYTYQWLGKTELIYTDAVDTLVRLIRRRIETDQQTIIHIGGTTGSGKSSLGLNIAWRLQKALGQEWNLQRDYILTGDDLAMRVHFGPDTGVLLMDEAYLTLASVRGSTKASTDVVDLFTTMRSKHFTVIMCSPVFTRINNQIRQNFVDFSLECSSPQKSWIKGIGRGLFQCFIPQQRKFSKNPEPWWDLIFTGTFRDYPADLKEEYLLIKAKHQNRVSQNKVKALLDKDPTQAEFYGSIYGPLGEGSAGAVYDNTPDPDQILPPKREKIHEIIVSKDDKPDEWYSPKVKEVVPQRPPRLYRPRLPNRPPELDENGNPIKRKPGRPKGSKDRYQRVVMYRTPKPAPQVKADKGVEGPDITKAKTENDGE